MQRTQFIHFDLNLAIMMGPDRSYTALPADWTLECQYIIFNSMGCFYVLSRFPSDLLQYHYHLQRRCFCAYIRSTERFNNFSQFQMSFQSTSTACLRVLVCLDKVRLCLISSALSAILRGPRIFPMISPANRSLRHSLLPS